MDQVEFIIRTTDSVWIRDYGPRFIFEDGVHAIIDHTYNRPRPNDNLLNNYIAWLWGIAQYDIPLTHGGGNFHLFSNGDAFMSSLILSENPSLTEQDVQDLFSEYQNLNVTIYEGFPTWFDSTRHIDMWMLPVGDDRIIIGEYAPATGLPYTITENAVADLTSRGYTVFRTPGWRSGGAHYTYTNAVIMNDLVFVPTYASAQDATALAVFEEAMPDHTIVGIDCRGIIGAAGAIHCIVMHMPGTPTTMSVIPGSDLVSSGNRGGPFVPSSLVYTLRNNSDSPINYNVTNSQDWITVVNASGTIGAHDATTVTVVINAAADLLDLGEYADAVQFINTTDHDGDTVRSVALTVGVPVAAHRFLLDANPGWSAEGEWAFGRPDGGGGDSNGNPDPSSPASGRYVWAVNLYGDYSTDEGGPYYLTTAAIDMTGYVNATLEFRRWLNTDGQPYVSATVEASSDGVNWTLVWENGQTPITDSEWTLSAYDISVIADGQTELYVRWAYEVGPMADAYSGWNIDDIEIWALPASAGPGDFDDDGDIDLDDYRSLVACLGGPDQPPALPDCDDAKLDADDDVDMADVALFATRFTSTR